MATAERVRPPAAGAAAVAPPARGWRTTFAALGLRDYRWLWLGTLCSFTAMQLQQVARGYLAYEISGSALSLGFVALAAGLPQIMLGPIGGVVVDRVPKRTMLYFTQATMGLTSLATAILVWSGTIQVWHLVVLAGINGAVFAFNLPARQSLIPVLVPEAQLANAMALTNSGTQLTRLIGPTLAGLLVAIPLVGTGGTFFLMFGLYVLVCGMLFQLRDPGNPLPRPASESFLDAMGDGFKFILRSPSIVILFVLAMLMVFLGQPYLTMMPVFAALYGVDAFGLGILLTAAGAGGLAGSLVVAYFSDVRRKGLYQLLCAIGFGLSLIVFGLTANFWVALPLLVLTGVSGTAMQVYNSTLIMLNTPQRLYGRVMAIYLMTFGLMPLSTLPLAAITEAFGPQVMVIGCGIGMVLVASLLLVFARNHRGDAPLFRPA